MVMVTVAETTVGELEMLIAPPALASELSVAGSVTAADTAAASEALAPTPVMTTLACRSSRRRLAETAVTLTLAVACTDAGSCALSAAAMAAAAAALRLSMPLSERVKETGRSVMVTVTLEGSTPRCAATSAAACTGST
jgi:hypothetical protein